MSIRKQSLQEFQHQIKDVRSQLFDQIKCLEQRTDVQCAILHEVNDFLKKRAEIDLEYSKQLDKLVKSVMLKHKNEKQKRVNWSIYSACSLWQQLVDDTKEEAKQRGITSEVYGNHVSSSVTTRCATLQKISKKCREIGVLAQGEIIRVLNELQTAMKTYQLCYSEFSVVSSKLQQAEVIKNKSQESMQSTRKLKSIQKSFNKRSEKFEAARLKCNRARNEYLLCIDAANAALHKFFADDLSDLIDCTDLGMEYWMNLILTNIVAARKAACQTEMNSLANLGTFKDAVQPQVDKQRFFESNSSTFMLPKRFEFKCDANEVIDTIALGEGLSEELKQRHHQIKKRLCTLRTESDASWRTLEETEQRIRAILTAFTLVDVTEFGIADHRPPVDSLENEMSKAYDVYLQNFSFFLFNANLIMRLEARADGIGNSLSENGVPLPISNNESLLDNDVAEMGEEELADWHERNRRKKRIGSQASAATNDTSQSNSSPRRRPRLFGGSLEEYVEVTGEKIPLVVISCVRVLSQFALHHQGIFRVSGSQVEINHMRDSFERGEDPLRQVQDSSDVNSISGVLKLYLRELREPLFPFYLFELLTNCAKCSSTVDFINQITPLLKKLPSPTYLLLRYLFAFLNHLSEFSDENMMDPYNLAICFGPTLLPIPEGKDQVYYQNYVNEVVKNLIVHCDAIFSAKVLGPRYQKYDLVTDSAADNNEIELFVDDADELYFGNGSNASGDVTNGTFSSEVFDYASLQQTLDELEFQGIRHSNGAKPFQTHTQQPMPSLMSTSTYSGNSSSFMGRLPPSVTATLVKSSAGNGAVVPGGGVTRGVNPTYCYSSQSSENGSLNNGNPGLFQHHEAKLKDGIDRDRSDRSVLDTQDATPKAITLNQKTNASGTTQPSPPFPTSTGSRRSSASANTDDSLVNNALGSAALDTSNYSAIVGKSERIRIAMAPPPPNTTPTTGVAKPTAAPMTSPPNNSSALSRTLSERSGQNQQISNSNKPASVTVTSTPPTLPSYSALYGQEGGNNPKKTPTIHLPLNMNTNAQRANGGKTITNPGVSPRSNSVNARVLATAAIASVCQGLSSADTDSSTASSPIKHQQTTAVNFRACPPVKLNQHPQQPDYCSPTTVRYNNNHESKPSQRSVDDPEPARSISPNKKPGQPSLSSTTTPKN